MKFKLIVNGQPAAVHVPADMPLLWVVREILRLPGTKYGCGIGVCGACTVHVNGNAVRSCTTPIASVGGKKVTTIEGLSRNGNHPLQRAWTELDVSQCGYCQSGQIMSAAALLAKHPSPSDRQINEAMDGNLCRCGTYLRIRQAIHEATVLAGTGSKGPLHRASTIRRESKEAL